MPPSGRSSFIAPASAASLASISTIFDAMKQLRVHPKSNPPFISLAMGDPTVFGNLKTPSLAVDAVRDAVSTYKANGYTDTEGSATSRAAVAKTYSCDEFQLTKDDVFLSNGASGALWLAIGALCPKGSNILLPRPGFTYSVAVHSMEVECRYYDCLPEENWQIDLKHLESLIDENTSVILVNNPSNPCGSNFTREHLEDILTVASRNFLPIISDEIYAGINWTKHPFTALYSLPSNVPIITIGGLAKRWLVPGWRLGWVVLHDRNEVFKDVRRGLVNLSQVQLHPSTVFQAALPTILNTPQEFFDGIVTELKGNAKVVMEELSKAPGLQVIEPQGALYAMVRLEYTKWKDIGDTFAFAQKLIDEENVLCLPGECFFKSGFIRIVISHPAEVLREACTRITNFCKRHAK